MDSVYSGKAQTAISLGSVVDNLKDDPYAIMTCLFSKAVDEIERLIGDEFTETQDSLRLSLSSLRRSSEIGSP